MPTFPSSAFGRWRPGYNQRPITEATCNLRLSSVVLRNELGNNLREKLPEYMLPSTFILLDALLATQNSLRCKQILPHGRTHTSLEPCVMGEGVLCRARKFDLKPTKL